MTPWQLAVAADAYYDRTKAAHRSDAWHAWQTAWLQRVDHKKFPTYADFVADKKASKVIDQDAIKGRLKSYSERVKHDNGGKTISGPST